MERRNFPVRQIRLISSSGSAGKRVPWKGSELIVEELADDSFNDIDIAFFSAGSDISRDHAGNARKAGAVVIDNSPAFRMDSDVPLVIPEINGDDVRGHKGIVANPNCTAAIALMALYPLHRLFGVKRAI